jgi:hypothetical protein
MPVLTHTIIRRFIVTVAIALVLAQPAVAAPATFAMGATTDVAAEFVAAANRGDYRTVCSLYSARYLRVSRAACGSLYSWGARLYGPYDYRIVARRTLANGHRRVDLIRWKHPSFIELVHEPTGWRIAAGGW